MATTNLNPNFDRVSFKNVSAVITSTVGTDDTTIKADIGTLPAGSIAIASDGKIWVMVTTTWTNLTIN